MILTPSIKKVIADGALFVINDSAGKDSQAMKIKLANIIPASQLVIVHATLPGMEWEGNMEHIRKYAMGIEVHEVRAQKTFFEMVEHRKMFPSPKNRQCTSDLKRGPIQKFINNYCRQHGFGIVVNCMGLRAQESPGRSKKIPFQFKPQNSSKARKQYEWLPIHDMLIEQVWSTIAFAGQQPHYAYGLGMQRLSCPMCIMGCESDLKIGAKHNPEMAAIIMEK